MTAPLSGIRVCDVSQNLAGPFCAQILADLGAEVIKVEPPGGDLGRAWGPPFWGSTAVIFLSVNRGKRSVVLDLKRPEGRKALHRIAGGCDVFLQSARVGVPERLGCDYDSIRAVREDVVHLSVTAFGDRGPLRDFPGYDPLIQAYSGIMSVTGHPGGEPARVGGSVVDYGTGMWGAIAVLAALRTRDATGKGSRLDTALLDTAVGWISYHVLGYLATGRIPGPMGSGLDQIVPYQAFPTSDGSLMIAAGNDAIFRRLCEALGVPEWSTDPRFATNPDRVTHREELVPLVASRTRLYTTQELLDRTRRHSVPTSPIHDIAEVVADPQVEAAELIAPAPHPEVAEFRDISIPLRIDGDRPRNAAGAPLAGEHTHEILEEVGYSLEERRRLVASGVATALEEE
jgi:crotonobetainyl-CoA:carnitine CoA-transferase CaiB-like acyl-CoA transferase